MVLGVGSAYFGGRLDLYLQAVLDVVMAFPLIIIALFFFNDTATTEIYTLSLHDALPNWPPTNPARGSRTWTTHHARKSWAGCSGRPDRKSTRLNSSHVEISYAVFCF